LAVYLIETHAAENALTAPRQEVDERLLIEAAQKDPARFAEVYERSFERVYAYVARRIANRDEAQDVTSEVFHQALANLGKFEWRGVPFMAWLLRIAANTIADRWRHSAREQSMDDPEAPQSFPEHAANIEEVERRALLFRLVRTLPADQRRVIEMRFAQEKSIREISTEMKRSEGAVKQLQFRAIQGLRAQLEGETGKKSGEANA
jgi:RNA polymerase sigma-70 factor, ECF subfamily